MLHNVCVLMEWALPHHKHILLQYLYLSYSICVFLLFVLTCKVFFGTENHDVAVKLTFRDIKCPRFIILFYCVKFCLSYGWKVVLWSRSDLWPLDSHWVTTESKVEKSVSDNIPTTGKVDNPNDLAGWTRHFKDLLHMNFLMQQVP